MSEQRAINALKAEIDALEEAQKTLRRVIARKKMLGNDVTEERADMARISRRLGQAHDTLAELEAGRVVVSAPSPGEMTAARRHAWAVRDISTTDAMTRSGLELIWSAVTETRETARKVT